MKTLLQHKPLLVICFLILLLIAVFYAPFETSRTVDAQRSLTGAKQKMLVGSMTGRVFQDYNGDGLYDTAGGTSAQPIAVDRGLSGITVSAYDAAGLLQGTAVTAADGTYVLTAAGTGPYRVEFTDLPAGFSPSARSTASVSGGTSTTSGSTVHFVADGNTADVNLAVNRPSDYCQNNPDICSQLYGFGDDNYPDALFQVPFWAGSTRTTGGDPVFDFMSPGNAGLATTDQIGTTFGLAYHRSSRRIFTAAYMKKHSKFGPVGTGAIYAIDRNTNTVSTFVDLNSVFGPGTAGLDPHDPNDYDRDNGQATWNAVGKIAFGGIALTEDQQYLFAMNLADRRLYRIPTTGLLNSSTIQSVAFPATMPNCPNAVDVRPFAVAQYAGTIYVGAVCSQESAVPAVTPDLRGYVYTFDPTAMAFDGTPVLNFPLTYTRLETDPDLSALWNNWRAVYHTISGAHFIYPQPLFTDIDFDRGNMILSIRDRNGDQSSYHSMSNPDDDTQLFKGITAGDLLRACGDPTSGWILESNGRCGGLGIAPQNTGEGPDDAEYYFQDNYRPDGWPHDEVGLGAAVQVPGLNVVATTMFDPPYLPEDFIFDAGGFRWFVNDTGEQNRGYLAYRESHFGKSNGIGNLEALCDAAPIEIGNRIWYDADGDGVQDPGELPIVGVTVRLFIGSTLVATAVTDANGEYYFVSSTVPDADITDNIGLVNGGILTNTTYQIRLDNLNDYMPGGPLEQRRLTAQDTNTQLGDTDASDSDASYVQSPAGSPTGSIPVIEITTGGPGSNDHTLDIGFTFAPTSANVFVEGRVMTSDGAGIRNAAVLLQDAAGNQRHILTGTFGYFRFEDLTAGETVIITVNAKRYEFKQPSRMIVLEDNISGVDFIGF